MTPLGLGVAYDSHIHGSWRSRWDETNSRLAGRDGAPDERDWVREYVDVRRRWLLSRGELLSRTVYRMDAFRALMDADNWDLVLPFWVRGVWLDESEIGPDELDAVAQDGESPRPILRWKAPNVDADDVRLCR